MTKPKKKSAAGILWTEQTFKLTDLRPYERNPRKITPDQLAKLKASIEQDGFHQRLLVTPDGRLIGGHQRLKVLTDMGYTEVQALVPNRDLTEDEYKRLNVRDNIVAGEWDFEALIEDFEVEELIDLGFSEAQISGLAFGVEKGKKYADGGTTNKSRMLVFVHPDCARMVFKFQRWHHFVDYNRFKDNKLIRKQGLVINPNAYKDIKLVPVKAK